MERRGFKVIWRGKSMTIVTKEDVRALVLHTLEHSQKPAVVTKVMARYDAEEYIHRRELMRRADGQAFVDYVNALVRRCQSLP